MRSLTQELSAHLVGLDLSTVPSEVVDKAKSCVLDTTGVALAGTTTPWARSAIAAALDEGRGGGAAHVLGTSETASTAMAASANGTSGHSLDFDDDNAQVHAGAAVVATAMAMAEQSDASGRDVLRSVIGGYEAAVRVAWAMDPDALYARGFHPTGVCNAFGSAAAAAMMAGLDEDTMTHAFGIVASMAGGLLEFYTDGAMTKRLHGGHPALCGVMAVSLAAHGFTGPTTVLEGPFGALKAYSGQARPDRVTRDLGSDFMILSTAQKYYPMNFSTHAAIDCVRLIMDREGLEAGDVKRVTARIRPFVAEAIGGPSKYRPATVLAAQMSLPFAVAMAMSVDRITLDHLTPEWIGDERVLAEAAKVETVASAELDAIEGIEEGSILPARVTVETQDGRRIDHGIDYQRGDPHNPLSDDDLRDKFLDCAARAVGADRARHALERLATIEEWDGVRSFMVGLQV